MINHARTLLINRNGVGFTSQPGEEYTPPSFKAVELPTFLDNIRGLLFGFSPDMLMLNYRARQYMTLLHATELVEFVTDLDPRITYTTGSDDLFDDVFKIAVRPFPDTTSELFILNELDAIDKLGRTFHRWRVEVLSSSTVNVIHQTPHVREQIQDYTISAGLSSLVDLIESPLQCRFQDSIGARWTINAYSRPSSDLGQILASLQSQTTLLQLFGLGTQRSTAEPFRTFFNLWRHHHELPYQLGAILLAVIYWTEDLRKGLR